MITPKRDGDSVYFDQIVEKEAEVGEGMSKTASAEKAPEAPAAKDAAVAKDAGVAKDAAVAKVASMSLFEVRKARREGKFIKVAGRTDLYQDAATKDFWKLSDDKTTVVRAFNEKDTAK